MGKMNYDYLKSALDDAKIGASQLLDVLKEKNNLKSVSAEEILATLKLHELVKSKEEPIVEKRKDSLLVTILAFIGIIALIAGVAYAVYCYLTPDYLDDYDEDEDEMDEDFFEDEDDDPDIDVKD